MESGLTIVKAKTVRDIADEVNKPVLTETSVNFINEVSERILSLSKEGKTCSSEILLQEDTIWERELIAEKFREQGYEVGLFRYSRVKPSQEKADKILCKNRDASGNPVNSVEFDALGNPIDTWFTGIRVPTLKYSNGIGWLPAYQMDIRW